jgi:putative FmdB family regulatory protein
MVRNNFDPWETQGWIKSRRLCQSPQTVEKDRQARPLADLFSILQTRSGRYFMPMYDYKCLGCGKESLVVLTLKQHESNKVTCPKCSSTKMQQLYSSFVAHTTKKS